MPKFTAVLLLFISQCILAQDAFNIHALHVWTDTLIPYNYRESRFSEVWGVAYNNREYGIIGSTLGCHFIDVTDPDNVHETDFVAAAVQGYSANHRDYHDYNGYLYTTGDQDDFDTGEPCSLQIIGLHYLPDSVQLLYDSSELFKKSHNIFIDTASAILYVCGATHADNTQSSLALYSLENPVAPTLISTFNDVGYIHDVYVRNDTAYCHQIYDNILYIINFSDPLNPAVIGSLNTYPDQEANHSGWLNNSGNYYVLIDEAYGASLKVCDVSDLNDIQVLSTFSSGVSDLSIAHNVMIKDHYAYVSYYNDGLWVFDISDPYDPTVAGYYDTFPSDQEDDYRGAWGVYAYLPSGRVLISDRQSGLFLLDVSEAIGNNTSTVYNPAWQNNDTQTPLKVYPQPFSNYINIALPLATNIANIYLFDITGAKQTILSSNCQTNNCRIQLPQQLPKGIYCLQVQTNTGTHSVKVCK